MNLPTKIAIIIPVIIGAAVTAKFAVDQIQIGFAYVSEMKYDYHLLNYAAEWMKGDEREVKLACEIVQFQLGYENDHDTYVWLSSLSKDCTDGFGVSDEEIFHIRKIVDFDSGMFEEISNEIGG